MSGSIAPLIITPVVLIVGALWQKNLSKNFDYVCGNCGARFTPSPLAAAAAPHRFGGLKLLRCPQCGRLTWASAQPRTDLGTS